MGESCPRLNNGTFSFLWNGAERFWAERIIGEISLDHHGGMEAVFRKYGFGCYLFVAYTDGFRGFFVMFTVVDWIG